MTDKCPFCGAPPAIGETTNKPIPGAYVCGSLFWKEKGAVPDLQSDECRIRELEQQLADRDKRLAEIAAHLGTEIERLRKQVSLLHDATIVLRNGMGGHNHWDHTMRHGAGCEVCIEQQKARREADRLISEAGKGD